MLTKIRCDAFVEDIRELAVRPGLNTILGSSEGSNAIGKSTFLWIIDFIFGGQQYSRLMPGMKQYTGSQVIYFTFKFDGEEKYFFRITDEPAKVFSCDAIGHPIEDMTLEKYNEFLRQSYKLDIPGLTFPGITSHFFRIYGGGNIQEWKPMKGRSESNTSSIDFLMRLFGYGTLLGEINRMEDDLNIKIDQLFMKKLVQPINYTDKIEENNATIKAMNERLQKLLSQSDDIDFAILGLDTKMIETVSRLQKELRQITVQYEALRSQIDTIEINLSETISEQSSEFAALVHFFPNANIKAFEDIEMFHRQLREILHDEMQDEINRLQPMVNFYMSEINRLKGKIQESGITRTISERIMSQAVSVKQRIETLQAENEQLEHEKELLEERTVKLNRLRALADRHKTAVQDIEKKINELAEIINAEVTSEKEKAPVLSMASPRDIYFSSPENISEGTAYKNLVLYDLCLAQLCPVPVIIHDSNILKRIDDAYLEQILLHYQKCGSQVFIAFDKAEATKPKAKTILEESTLLHLYDGHELFGQSWSKVPTQPERKWQATQEGDNNGGNL